MEGGLDREKSNLVGWSEDRKQCGRWWSFNSCGWGRFSLLGESDPEEQRRCGCVECLTRGQEMQTFFTAGRKLKSRSVGGFGRLQHNHVVKHHNSAHLQTEMTTFRCYNRSNLYSKDSSATASLKSIVWQLVIRVSVIFTSALFTRTVIFFPLLVLE